MTTVDKGSAEASTVPAAVYLLQRHDGQRFKIGWAMEPVSRVQRLPEFQADELDLVGSHVAWLPDAGRAKQIERALHRGLAAFQVVPPHHLDGYTEWFRPEAHRTSLGMIRQMPFGKGEGWRLPLCPSSAGTVTCSTEMWPRLTKKRPSTGRMCCGAWRTCFCAWLSSPQYS